MGYLVHITKLHQHIPTTIHTGMSQNASSSFHISCPRFCFAWLGTLADVLRLIWHNKFVYVLAEARSCSELHAYDGVVPNLAYLKYGSSPFLLDEVYSFKFRASSAAFSDHSVVGLSTRLGDAQYLEHTFLDVGNRKNFNLTSG